MVFAPVRALGAAIGCLIVIASLHPALAGPKEDAQSAFKRGDYATAFRITRSLAEKGDPEEQIQLASLYYYGKGTEKNDSEALKWSRKAAEQGNADGQYNVGVAYDKALSVPQNYVEALKWYRKAADQGNAQAQLKLGVMYDAGRGVARNGSEAAKWYLKAAEQGDPSSQLGLGGKYAAGVDVPLDNIKAYMWYALSASRFQLPAGAEPQKLAAQNRDAIAASMTKAELAQAQKLVSEWKPK